MSSVGDIANVIEAQNVGGERAQAGENAGVAADAAGVLGKASVTHIVGAVFYAPMVPDGAGADGGGQNDVADEERRLASGAPQPGCRGTGQGVATDADQRSHLAGPFGAGQAVTWGEHLDATDLVA